VAGTTGYEFLNRVNGVFVAADGEAGLTDLYQRFTGQTARYEDVVHAAKHQIMSRELAAEVERLVRLLADICQAHRRHRDHTRRDLRTAMREVLAAFPVYRTYVRVGQPVTEEDRACVLVALRDARERRPELDAELLEFIGELLLLEHDGAAELELALRFQQVSSPVMAKGIEDTAFYRYHRLVSLNEVGGDPGGFGRSVDSFHEVMQTATTSWPDAMVTLSTHDTKRSSDVRARIDLLSELPGAWAAAVDRWATGNEQHRRDGWPDRNIEYLLYQTLVGAWPIGADRVVAFVNKAAREAKVHTSWTSPDPGYDSGLESFVRAVLADRDFTDDVERFLTDQRIVELGRVGSLAQTALHLTCPGVPDIYQGTEVWDLSLVDPDNRRAVDYDQRRRLLRRLLAGGLDDALATPDEGGPKLWLVHRLLHHRARRPERYRDGSYLPLATSGARSRHALAFHRDGLVVVVPRLVAGNWFEPEPWADTSVDIPAGRWNDVLTDDRCEGGTIPVAELLRRFPVAVLDRDDG
jgi:(1->4)-alpha-D-glucan 1-alpha-D-glucosylmutase